jgi:hypothetical protein
MRVVKYLKWRLEIKSLGLNISINKDTPLIEAWSDASQGTGPRARSLTGYLVKVCGTTVYAASKVQPSVALSSAEAELYAAVECAKKIMWIRKIVDFCINDSERKYVPVLYTDSASLIHMCQRGSPMRESRHILLRWHYLFDLVDEGVIEIKFIAGVDNPIGEIRVAEGNIGTIESPKTLRAHAI